VRSDSILSTIPYRVVLSWLTEFGYTKPDVVAGLDAALRERGPDRLHRELDIHGKRLAERAQMSRAPVGRASVIR